MRKVKVINGIEVYSNELLTLSVSGKIVLYADAKHFEKLAKSVMKQEGILDTNKWYDTLINTGEVANIKFDSIFINEIIHN
jgi:hypothetical protein